MHQINTRAITNEYKKHTVTNINCSAVLWRNSFGCCEACIKYIMRDEWNKFEDLHVSQEQRAPSNHLVKLEA